MRTVILNLHGVCNQECSYCVAGSSPANTFGAITEQSKVQSLLNFFAGAEPSNILCTGGEPLITPGFGNLCHSLLSLGHVISLQTNLKKDPQTFMAAVPPERTDWILASLHSVALENFDRFLAHACLLKSSGYPLVVKLVLDELMLNNFKLIYETLTISGIGTMLAPLVKFPQNGDPRPKDYSQQEWDLIAPRVTLLSSWLYFDGGFTSSGTQCAAGSDLLNISMSDGSIRGCSHGFPPGLGNIYQGLFTPCDSLINCGLPLCICDFHYYLGIIKDVDDSKKFKNLLKGPADPVPLEAYRAWLQKSRIKPLGKLGTMCTGHSLPDASAFSVPEYDLNISLIHVFDLHTALGFDTNLDYPKSSLTKKFSQWKMEIDDAPIFRYIYRNVRPRRHLEFGTWQGKGTVFCLDECDATVWTINRPFGEHEGAYGFDPEELADAHLWALKVGMQVSDWGYASDSIGFIGKDYLELNLGNRVCQVYCDSREWDASNIPEGFFDSILVDGGHIADVVASDTRKALPLLRSGGIIMWHDFCPTDYQKFEACRGVIAGVAQEWALIKDQTEKLFWVYPSMILVGIKK